jgi:hypothetical protein
VIRTAGTITTTHTVNDPKGNASDFPEEFLVRGKIKTED